MNTKLEIAQHIANRGSNALLKIESLCITAKKTFEDGDINPAVKAGLLANIIDQIYNKVIEGTESTFIIKK